MRDHGPLDAVQRLDIYANMYFFRLLDVLRDDYPATPALLGDVSFHNLVTDYLLAHPPAHFSIREAGRGLPEVLDGHAVRSLHPCAGDLARFERALNDAFDAADADPLTAADLSALPAERWPELRFTLHPSFHPVVSEWPVQEVRDRTDRQEAVVDPEPRATRLGVWREGLVVRHRELSAVELSAVDAVQSGASFAAVCATAAELTGDTDAATYVAAALGRWVAQGWIIHFEPAG